ncbi:MAG: C_GCAxxG_C_C family protein [Melioribacteraceae bacterium]|nr:C_GCAxxG_C_C family protein [Melioribacteraceae bacterium]
MKKSDQAKNMFMEGYSCSQAVYTPFAVDLGIDKETALKISSSFGGGIAGSGKTCGAVTGAILAIGLKYGNTDPDNTEAKQICYDKGNLFLEKFKELNNSKTECNDLVGYKRNDISEHNKAKELGLYKTICPNLVTDAANILEEILGS